VTQTEDRAASVGPVPIKSSVATQSTASIGHVMRRRSVIAEAGWFQAGTPEQRRRLVEATQEAARTAARRRTLVLAHPDLAGQLVRRLGYDRPDQWNGYVPPRFYEAGRKDPRTGRDEERWFPIDTRRGHVLAELVAEAEARGSS
jgi:hypothetical protein